MKYRQLGSTGVFVSRICLGTMTFGGKDQPPYDVIGGLSANEVDGLVGVALDAGVNFVDTADVYSAGESETLLGAALKQRRREVVLATKFHARTRPGPNQVGQSRLHLMQSLEDSLRRLQTDCIDLYQIHNFDPLTPFDETLRALTTPCGKTDPLHRLLEPGGVADHESAGNRPSARLDEFCIGAGALFAGRPRQSGRHGRAIERRGYRRARCRQRIAGVLSCLDPELFGASTRTPK
jgi:hypothetical protein